MSEINAFDRIIGYEDIKAELEELGDVLQNTNKYRQCGVRTPRGLLLSGRPGIGKTLMAKCLIEVSGRKSFICRKSEGKETFTGIIREMFEKAREAAPSVVLLDDMDKFANDDEWHINSEEFVTIQACMDEISEEVFVIATVNDLRQIPESLLRKGRFDRKIEVPGPDHASAVKIVRHYLSEKKSVGNVDAGLIASILNGESCAALETIINEAGIQAVRQNRQRIEMEDILKACVRVLYDAPAALSFTEKKNIDRIAYHEAGHAIVSEVQEPGSVPLVSVCQGSGSTGGITASFSGPERYCLCRADMEKQIRTALGGRAAVELVFGDADMGAREDMRAAAAMVRQLMDVQSFTGFEIRGYSCSELTQARKEEALEREILHYYEETRRILAENRTALDKLAGLLMKKRIVIGDELRKMKLSAA